jgi:hypothetical protein
MVQFCLEVPRKGCSLRSGLHRGDRRAARGTVVGKVETMFTSFSLMHAGMADADFGIVPQPFISLPTLGNHIKINLMCIIWNLTN